MEWIRRFAAAIAWLLIASLGVGFYVSGLRALGVIVATVGLGLAANGAWKAWRERDDPYDLSKLYEVPPDDSEPSPEDELLRDERGVAYCYHCGHAVADPLGRCPECGGRL